MIKFPLAWGRLLPLVPILVCHFLPYISFTLVLAMEAVLNIDNFTAKFKEMEANAFFILVIKTPT